MSSSERNSKIQSSHQASHRRSPSTGIMRERTVYVSGAMGTRMKCGSLKPPSHEPPTLTAPENNPRAKICRSRFPPSASFYFPTRPFCDMRGFSNRGYRIMVVHELPKLMARVRFPLPAPTSLNLKSCDSRSLKQSIEFKRPHCGAAFLPFPLDEFGNSVGL